jgi:hypothetical protein
MNSCFQIFPNNKGCENTPFIGFKTKNITNYFLYSKVFLLYSTSITDTCSQMYTLFKQVDYTIGCAFVNRPHTHTDRLPHLILLM